MTRRRKMVITATMMLSLFMSSLDGTVVATAMPTIVAQLGGLAIYSWVFSAFMLASTTTIPIFGKLSDIYGRRPIYLIAIAIFLLGSFLCGLAQTMLQLVIFRAIQGIGAGGLMPLAFTIIGDIFTSEQRAKMQGVFSSVWGVSSVVGPLFGGFMVDHASWQWVFLINIPFGLIAAVLLTVAWRDVTPRTRAQVDFFGATLLTAAIVLFLLALFQLNEPLGWTSPIFWMLSISSILVSTSLLWVERRVSDPILPIPLFHDRLFSVAVWHGVLSGFALFGIIAFIPFFVQTVLATSATAAGVTLTPLLVPWALASIVGSRLLLRFSYRSIAMVGASLLAIGMALMTQVGMHTPQWVLFINVALLGMGMGLSVPVLFIAVQTSVPRQMLGVATSGVQFSRNIGGTIGVSVMGLILALRLSEALAQVGIDPKTVSLNALVESSKNASALAALVPLRESLATAMQGVFSTALIAAIAAWVVAALTPPGRIGTRPSVVADGASVPAGK